MSNILVVGSINMDVVASTNRHPKPGETILIDSIEFIPGGKGANAAVAAARLGANVSIVGAVGNDAFAETLRIGLVKNRIDCTHLLTINKSSGTAIITLDTNTAQNAIMVGMGANEDIKLPKSDAIFKNADVLLLQLETPIDINIEAAQRAKACNTLVILDPAPATTQIPFELLNHCDLISPNETELATLTGLPTDTLDQTINACTCLKQMGIQTIIAKMSDKGTYIHASNQSCHIPSYPIKPIDTTAAGDAFTACLATELAQQNKPYNLAAAVKHANAAGALACLKFGAQTSLPTQEELKQFIRSKTAY
ncbi:Ribokinase [Poriferisphaera corsica]|uniref:Ribokinase n=1 Tax=Poriferisphaera corsica TaxID=2528020 RepID=A0A517YS17_9BACT|nr:ribokinase [Poriferisphaera corsica]QDU33015.1 Ribokinase [Poriferisphaera corsica]